MDWIGAGASALSTLANLAFSNMSSKKQLRNSKDYFNFTFNKENARQDFLNANSGLIQKQSLRNAGLSASNLNGVPFSSNVANGGSISGNVETPQVDLFSQLLNAKQLDIQDKMADADIALKESEIAQNEANTKEIAENAKAQRSNLQSQTRLNTALYEKSGAEKDKLLADIQNDKKRLENETNIANISIEQMEANIKNLGVQTDINLKQLSWTDKLLAAQVTELRSKGRLNNAQAEKCYSDIKVNAENMKLIAANVGLTENQSLQVSAYTNLLSEQTSREHFDNQIRLLVGYDKYKQMEEQKVLQPMYENAMTLVQIKKGETERKVIAVRGATGAVKDIADSATSIIGLGSKK